MKNKSAKKPKKLTPVCLAMQINAALRTSSRVGSIIGAANNIHDKAPMMADLYVGHTIKEKK